MYYNKSFCSQIMDFLRTKGNKCNKYFFNKLECLSLQKTSKIWCDYVSIKRLFFAIGTWLVADILICHEPRYRYERKRARACLFGS